ncbi:MAG: DUF3108 domain-containing protein [Gemmatimonadota bacterium]
MSRPATRTCRLRPAGFLLAVAVPLLLSSGCWRGAKPPSGPESPPAPPAPATAEAPPGAAVAPPGGDLGEGAAAAPPEAGQAPPGTGAGPPSPAEGAAAEAAAEPPGAPAPETPPAEARGGESGMPAPQAEAAKEPVREGTPGAPAKRPGGIVVARLPESLAFDSSGPYWARGREELVYRVEFLGITMGYARFVFNGKVLLNGREVYHLSVRAWTSNVLSIIYPIDDTIDYFMDTRTLEPLRQEYTSRKREKDDVAIYDQETGRIVYRYKESGEVRKQVDAVPNVYDPVTLAYYIRSLGSNADEKGRNVYAGRKVWEISARFLGFERITTERGEVDTVVIQPVIKRNGKLEDKGDLRMWMTRDERRIPVRVYAKFRKIRTWTLVGELMPERKGG